MKHRMTQRNLPHLFLQARDQLMSHFRPILNHFGLTEQQWRVLRALHAYGPLESHALCTHCQMHSASMAGVLARMSALELVERNRVVADQRRILVSLSASGSSLIEEMTPLIELQYQKIEHAFGVPMVNELFRMLEAFVAADGSLVQRIKLPGA